MESGITYAKVGNRVQAHPATDSWMMGDRYGEIVKIGHKWIHVRMDRSGRIRKFSHVNLMGV